VLVSCICPTKDRAHLIPQMIASYQSQTWPEKELIILDDSDGLLPLSLENTIFDDPSITYLTSDPMNIPEKRNILVSLSRGQVIAHFDDDDWSTSDRIETQLALLEESGAMLVGYHSLLFWYGAKCQGWKYLGSKAYICGTSMVYHRELWEEFKFPETHAKGSDNEVTYRASRAGKSASADGDQYLVARMHDGQTQNTRNSIDSTNWAPIPREQFPEAFFRA